MIRTARAFYLSRALREKLLLVIFIAIGATWWLSAFGTRVGNFWREQRATTSRLAVQTEWIRNRQTIEEKAKTTAALLDPARTLNANQLVTTISRLASDAGLRNAQTSNPVTTPAGQFAVHSAEYMIRPVDWEALKKFYEALQERAPYIAMERFTLNAPANNPGQLSLNMRVTSVEIIR